MWRLQKNIICRLKLVNSINTIIINFLILLGQWNAHHTFLFGAIKAPYKLYNYNKKKINLIICICEIKEQYHLWYGSFFIILKLL